MTLGAVKNLAGIKIVQVVAPGLRQALQGLVGCVDGTRAAVGPHLSLHPQPALVSIFGPKSTSGISVEFRAVSM